MYQDLWETALGDELQCKREPSNLKDRYIVAVIKDKRVVGHLPQKISVACSLFIHQGVSIKCEVDGTRRYSADLPHARRTRNSMLFKYRRLKQRSQEAVTCIK